jgi:hypothetical protein
VASFEVSRDQLVPARDAYASAAEQPHYGCMTQPTVKAQSRAGRRDFEMFRLWRAHALPSASYRIAPRLWTAAGLERAGALDNAARCAAKSRESAATGIAFTARHIHLTVAAPALDADLVGRALWYAHLFRRDPDYAEFRERHLHAVVLAFEAEREVIEFARRHKVRAVVFPARWVAEATPATLALQHD